MPDKNENNIFFVSGTTGIGIKDIVDKMVGFLPGRERHSFEIIKFEDFLRDELGETILDILVKYFSNPRLISKKIQDVIAKLIKEIKKLDNVIIITHFTYYIKNMFIPNPLPYLIMHSKRIMSVLFLIDDYYHSLNNISKKKEEVPFEHPIDPLTYLRWRGIDFGYCLSLLTSGTNVFIFALKHREETFKRFSRYLLLTENYGTIYFSHPITQIRKENIEKGVPMEDITFTKEIEAFKTKLINEYKNIILFEPTTIDELIYDRNQQLIKKIHINQRWPHNYKTLVEYQYPIDLEELSENSDLFDPNLLDNMTYLKDLEKNIRNQIYSRDFFYINQSRCIFAYQPILNGIPSSGVLAEISNAVSQGKNSFVYFKDMKDREKFITSQFQYISSRIIDERYLGTVIENCLSSKKKYNY